MGNILKNSRRIFDELIGTKSFDNIFKNSIRDYYIYGFKSYQQFTRGRQRLDDQWKVLSSILGVKWYLDREKDGRKRITLKTEAVGSKNPLDDLYFLHNLSMIGDYLNYLLDLAPHSCVRGGIEQLPVDRDTLESLDGKSGRRALIDANELEYAIIQNWLNQIAKENPEPGNTAEIRDSDIGMPVRMNRQLDIWSNFGSGGSGSKYRRNLSNRTRELYAYGILKNLKDDPERRNAWLQKEWRDYSSGKRYLEETSGKDYWFKSDLTMEKLTETFGANPPGRHNRLCELKAMCSFFSQYYPLGEIGTILAERCGRDIPGTEVFKFKHNYLQKTLYDYNLMDLLIAIENSYLCRVRYSHGVHSFSFEEIMIPLEIRISVQNGREYIMYYHLTEQKIKALRLEFIDEIVIYSKVESIRKVKRVTWKAGRKKNTEEMTLEELDASSFDPSVISKQISIAKQMLKYIWGTEVTDCFVSDSWRERLVTYEFDISYAEDEKYIQSRLEREDRIRSDGRSLTIFPTKELRTWFRSFYVRVKHVKNIDTEEFRLADDVESMWENYFGKNGFYDRDNGTSDQEEISDNKERNVESGYEVNGKIVPETEGHAALFNELFSKYTIVLANAVLNCSADSKADLEEELRKEIQQYFDYYDEENIQYAVRELKEMVIAGGLIDKYGQPRFLMPPCDYLFQLLPLTRIEIRWLLTVLDDPLAEIFLEKEWITGLKNLLNRVSCADGAFPMQSIYYFDRYHLNRDCESEEPGISEPVRMTEGERKYLRQVYRAMKSEKKIRVLFRNWKGEERTVICAPVWMEYSRRDDLFRIWYVNHKVKKIMKINLSRIVDLTILQDSRYRYHLDREKELLDEAYQKSMTRIKVEFYQGTRNLPDRILTEFSLWKKKCVYDIQTEKYTMTLHYPTEDEKEILVRLLGYGPYIRILAEDDNYVLKEIKRRLSVQRDLIQTREFEYFE